MANADRSQGRVAFVLAVGLVLAVAMVTAGVLYDAIFSEGPGLSDNATQVLTLAFGGIIGLLGGYIGYQAAETNGKRAVMTPTEPTPDETPSHPSEGVTEYEPPAPAPEPAETDDDTDTDDDLEGS